MSGSTQKRPLSPMLPPPPKRPSSPHCLRNPHCPPPNRSGSPHPPRNLHWLRSLRWPRNPRCPRSPTGFRRYLHPNPRRGRRCRRGALRRRYLLRRSGPVGLPRRSPRRRSRNRLRATAGNPHLPLWPPAARVERISTEASVQRAWLTDRRARDILNGLGLAACDRSVAHGGPAGVAFHRASVNSWKAQTYAKGDACRSVSRSRFAVLANGPLRSAPRCRDFADISR
jgi:hypothetical protein